MYGVGQGLRDGVNMASRIIFAGMDMRQRNRQLDLQEQKLKLQARAQSFKAFGDSAVWDNLATSPHTQPTLKTPSPAELLIPEP